MRKTINVTVQEPEGGKSIDEPVDFETAISLTGFGKFNYILLLVAFPAAMISVFDTTAMAYILPVAQCDLGLTNLDKGGLNAITYAGMITSAFMWGGLSDTLGRQRLLMISLILDGVLAVASAFAVQLWAMFLLRYFVGFIGCGAYAMLMSYLVEFHSTKYRSRCIMFTGIGVSTANYLIPSFALGLLTQQWAVEVGGGLVLKPWNVFIMTCSLPALLAGSFMSFFPETPKFLMSKGRNGEALAVFRKVYALNTGRSPDSFPVQRLVDELELRKASVASTMSIHQSAIQSLKNAWRQMRPLFVMPQLPKAVLVFSIQILCLFSLNTIRLWLPQIFATMEEFLYIHQTAEGVGMGSLTVNDSDNSVYLCDMLTYQSSQKADNSSLVSMLVNLVDGDILNATQAVASEIPCLPTVSNSRLYINSSSWARCRHSATAARASSSTGWATGLLICFFSSGAFGIGVQWSTDADLTLAMLSLYLALVGICSTCMMGVVVTIFPTSLRTTAVSLTMMFGRIAALSGNVIFPVLLDISCQLPFFLVSGVNIESKERESGTCSNGSGRSHAMRYRKAKFSTLRSHYGAELKKIRQSESSGSSGAVHRPRVWWFDHLRFLKDIITPR
ncbi:synaptic vesicle glycoprotein 2C-like [Schistocerca cancellata]|uniref:synaptic vesicle glycoprotein 2C-like n=1 Tax=Schistocerca cancellata TaxID=274614 RepID=UPI00211998DF|nr:synaptic vesicle glycoprotein 2C-like [Schistocerca cancellata]